MRGVAFIGGNAPPPPLCRQAVEGASLVVAADAGLITAEAAGVHADWVVGDMDSLEDTALLDKYAPSRIRRYPPDKDDTDTEIALRLLWDNGCGETVLIGGGGGRIDHSLALFSLFDRDPCPDLWLTDKEDVYCLKQGLFSENRTGLVSVFPVGAGPWRAASAGLRWALDKVCWKRGVFGISNRACGAFSVAAEAGKFLLVLPR